MRKKNVNSNAALPTRGRSASRKADFNPSIVDRFILEALEDVPKLDCDPADMYQFGVVGNPHILPGYNILLPTTIPTLQFSASDEIFEDELPQQHLLHSFISAELKAYGVDFGNYRHPFMHDAIVDENGQPQQMASDAEPDYVPVYPIRQPLPFSPPPYQQLPQDPFGTRQGHRVLLPKPVKGSRVPRSAPVDTFEAGEPAPTRGRKRALSPEGRAAAREVRIVHACGRCHKKREKCDPFRPCTACMGKNKRSLDFPCMRELPEGRWRRLFSEPMYGHLDLEAIKKAMPKRDPLGETFEIRLHQFFDDPELKVPVARFIPTVKHHVKKSIFPIGRSSDGFVVEQTEILSPPLVPAFNDIASYHNFLKQFYWSVRRWLDQAEIHHDIHWHRVFFREEYGKAWPRAIFGDVCKFFHRVTKSGCPVLKSCLQTTVLVYMIGHSFYVPEEDIEDVLEKSSFPSEPSEWVSPIFVDRFLKTLLLPVYKAGVKASLRGLQNLFSPAKPSAFWRDRMLATCIVLLIVAASQQGKAIEKALARDRQGHKVNTEDVFITIRDIEEDIVDLIMELWAYKFPPGVNMGGDDRDDRFGSDRAREFNLLERFKNSYYESSDIESLEVLPTELPRNLDSRKFGADNTERVLKKFHMVVFPREQ